MSDEQAATTARCPQCDGEMIRHADQEFCPVCLMQEGMRSSTVAGARVSWTPPTPEELVDKFPGLEIQSLLGQGGMGAVYRVRQIELDRIAALKILPEQVAQEPGFSERFLREARLLASLSHPHIVTVYEFGQREGTCFLLMEFVDGVTLRQALRTEPIHRLSPKEALTVVGQLCDALQFAHDEGVIHRDIKPENILIDKRGRVKIADFGLARMLGKSAGMLTLTGTNQLLGTPIYMAPEQIEGTGAVDHRVDIYSMGVVFYELLTGELPIGRFSPPSQRTELDARLDEVVLRALEKQPERRYQQASEVRTAVDGFRSPSTAAGSGSADQSRRFGPVVRTVATFAAGALFVLSLPLLLNWIDQLQTTFAPVEMVGIDSDVSVPSRAALPQPAMLQRDSDEFGSAMDSAYEMGGYGGYGMEMDDMGSEMPDMQTGAPSVGADDFGGMAVMGESSAAADEMSNSFGAGGISGGEFAPAADAGDPGGYGSSMGGEYEDDEGDSGFESFGMGGGYYDAEAGMGESGGSEPAQPRGPIVTFDDAVVQLNRDWFSQPVEDLEPVDAILTDMHRLYLELEQDNSVVAQEGDVLKTTVLIDPSDLDALINQLWTRLDDTVSREHQRELRDMLPLYSAAHPQMGGMAGGYPGEAGGYPGMSGGMGMSGGGAGMGLGGGGMGGMGASGLSATPSMQLPGLFGWHPDLLPCTVRVGREGRWYIWDVDTSAEGYWKHRVPELPTELLRFSQDTKPANVIAALRSTCDRIFEKDRDEDVADAAREKLADSFTHRGRISVAMSIYSAHLSSLKNFDTSDSAGISVPEAIASPLASVDSETESAAADNARLLLIDWPSARSEAEVQSRLRHLNELAAEISEEAARRWFTDCLQAARSMPPILSSLESERTIWARDGSQTDTFLQVGYENQAQLRLVQQDGDWLVDAMIPIPELPVDPLQILVQ